MYERQTVPNAHGDPEGGSVAAVSPIAADRAGGNIEQGRIPYTNPPKGFLEGGTIHALLFLLQDFDRERPDKRDTLFIEAFVRRFECRSRLPEAGS
jgi:hypothetical protein